MTMFFGTGKRPSLAPWTTLSSRLVRTCRRPHEPSASLGVLRLDLLWLGRGIRVERAGAGRGLGVRRRQDVWDVTAAWAAILSVAVRGVDGHSPSLGQAGGPRDGVAGPTA
jgi:hypothetical protein